MNVILASASPRRRELLKTLVNDFLIIPSLVDEDNIPIEQLSLLKAEEVAKLYPEDLVISADTVVILDNEILGKPKDKEDARQMLKKLSGKTHTVSTFYTLYCKNKNILITRQVISSVLFNDLSKETIDKYVASLSPLDKAGAYGIQDKEYNLIKELKGEEENVIGLPIKELREDLISLGIIPLK